MLRGGKKEPFNPNGAKNYLEKLQVENAFVAQVLILLNLR